MSLSINTISNQFEYMLSTSLVFIEFLFKMTFNDDCLEGLRDEVFKDPMT